MKSKTARSESGRTETPLTFKSTKATRKVTLDVAKHIGVSVLTYIADGLGSLGEPCFPKDGWFTDHAKAELNALARNGVDDWLEKKAHKCLNRTVINEIRRCMDLEPL